MKRGERERDILTERKRKINETHTKKARPKKREFISETDEKLYFPHYMHTDFLSSSSG